MISIPKHRGKYGFKRWIVLGLLALAAGAAFVGPRWYGPLKPVIPTVTLASEEIWPGAKIIPAFDLGSFHFPGIPFTNTVLSVLLGDLVLVGIGLFLVLPYVRGGNPLPSKLYLAFEMLLEYFWNLVKNSVGVRWAGRVFPIAMTIFLLILCANWIKMIPGYEVVGWLKPVEGEHGDKAHPAVPLAGGFYALDGSAAEGAGEAGPRYELVPFLRGAATDINFPASMAVFTVGCIFVFGFWAQKGAFLGKYLPLHITFSSPMEMILGFSNLLVGVLEFILEFVKIISLTLRLFGNIFAGGLLLMIVGSLTVVGVPAFLEGFEFFVGTIQAYVFALLTVIFIQIAMGGHGDGRESKH
ncbi:MAG: F0F1 ATP synthase subunit A [Anaerolineales bacterium]|nr:F0F1 ATP synthase subunit A [Anaerolineales bacterium]